MGPPHAKYCQAKGVTHQFLPFVVIGLCMRLQAIQ